MHTVIQRRAHSITGGETSTAIWEHHQIHDEHFQEEVFPSTTGGWAVAHPFTLPQTQRITAAPAAGASLPSPRKVCAVGGRSCGPRGGEDFLAPLPGMGHSSPQEGVLWFGALVSSPGERGVTHNGGQGQGGQIWVGLPAASLARASALLRDGTAGVDQVPSRGNTLHFPHPEATPSSDSPAKISTCSFRLGCYNVQRPLKWNKLFRVGKAWGPSESAILITERQAWPGPCSLRKGGRGRTVPRREGGKGNAVTASAW